MDKNNRERAGHNEIVSQITPKDIFKAIKHYLYETVMMDTYHYAFVRTLRAQ